MISIVITSYNRAKLVMDAIDSALDFINEVGQGEIIIVDDHSTDETVECIEGKYQSYLADGIITLIQHSSNLGVTGAKNSGVRIATGDWIIFLDSDDKLQLDVSGRMMATIQFVPASCPIIFFRCVDEYGHLIGPEQSKEYWLQLSVFLHKGTPGECLPIVRRSHFLSFNYEEDLRGFESLTYSKLINAFGSALVSPVVARVYSTLNTDRLCTKSNIRKRGCLISLGYIRLLRLFFLELGIIGCIKTVAKIIIHSMRCWYSKATS